MSHTTATADDSALLESDVLPILTKHCMGCHGGLRQKGSLDLRTLPAMLMGGESGPAVVSGDASSSSLWQRIASDEMPAGDRKPLDASEKDVIRRWIADGLPTVAQRRGVVDPLLPNDRSHSFEQVADAIDQHVEKFLSVARMPMAEKSDDVEFLRRLYLDLTGRIPTAEEAVHFLDDKSPNKRALLVDRLLASPGFGRQFGRTWRDWVCPPELPSNGNAGVQPHQQARAFGTWLGDRFNSDHSWDKIVSDILTVKGPIKGQPQVIFYSLVGQDGKTTADGSARATASLFMGIQLQCARCHDDPYRDWSQQEHWALSAFFGRSQGDFEKIEVGKGPSKTPGSITIPNTAFKNAGSTITAAFLDAAAFEVGENDDLRPPFVSWLTAKDNPFFAPAFANRVWFYLFSRGIVNPIDDFRDLNPPSHPGLMGLLANEFRASGFDTKHLFRAICNSDTYQRSSREAGTDVQQRDAMTGAFGRMPVRIMTADMLYDSLRQVYADQELDLRTNVKHSTVGMAAPVGDAYLEFQRRFETNEDDATDFTHGVSQMLTMINHPRLLEGSAALDARFFPATAALPTVSSKRNEDPFPTIDAKFVRFTVETSAGQPCIDELEIYGPESDTNLALATNGAHGSASSLLPNYPIHQIEHLNDGKTGNAHSWISNEMSGGWAQIELAAMKPINRVVWGRDRSGQYTDRIATAYRIEVSGDGQSWTRVSHSTRRSETPSKESRPIVTLDTKRQSDAIEWLYLSTLSRRPTAEEASEALEFTKRTPDSSYALNGVLWMLINRSEFLLVR